MRKYLYSLVCCLLVYSYSFSQKNKEQKIFTQDIDNFWIAYDSVRSTKDSLKQINFIQTLYIDKGTPGLKAFMKARDYSAALWVDRINKYPKFWNSIRSNTLTVKSKAKEIEKSIERFKALYLELKDAKMFFTIGALRSGGTVMDDKVLIGAEIATGDRKTDVSEFPDKWLANVFKDQSMENIIPLNIHEYVHTQQKGKATNLLSQAIREGSADFITELVIGRPMQTSYIKYGLQHEAELKEKFKQEMFTTAFSRWLYNSSEAEAMADLGYFMGYTISKSYYNNAGNKKQAIKDIIRLNYSDDNAIEAFLKKSKYYTEAYNKEQLVKEFVDKQPVLVKLEPFENGATDVDTSVKEITLVFSKPMSKGYSINYSDKGKEFAPITGIIGYSEDKTRFRVKVDLKPNKEYEFFVTNNSFKSSDGYPLLKHYTVNFKTK